MLSDIISEFVPHYKTVSVGDEQLVLLYKPYLPYEDHGEPFLLDNYFRCYDALYHAVQNLKNALSEKGVCCYEVDEKYDFKLLFVSSGLAKYCKNRLIRVGEFGTYCALYALGVKDIDKEDFSQFTPINPSFEYWIKNGFFEGCVGCECCFTACPTGALKDEFTAEICVRNRQLNLETHLLTDKERGRLLLGCNRCQNACPYNPKGREKVPEEVAALLSYSAMHEVINGGKQSISVLYPLIGKNYARPKKMNILLDVFFHKDK